MKVVVLIIVALLAVIEASDIESNIVSSPKNIHLCKDNNRPNKIIYRTQGHVAFFEYRISFSTPDGSEIHCVYASSANGATITMDGGPGFSYVDLDYISRDGEGIDYNVEIWQLI